MSKTTTALHSIEGGLQLAPSKLQGCTRTQFLVPEHRLIVYSMYFGSIFLHFWVVHCTEQNTLFHYYGKPMQTFWPVTIQPTSRNLKK